MMDRGRSCAGRPRLMDKARNVALIAGIVLTGCARPVPPSTTAASPGPCPITHAVQPAAVPQPVVDFMDGGMQLPAGMTPPPLATMFGNDAVWVDINGDGRLAVAPAPDGTLGVKFPTYRLASGSLVVTAERLDGPAGQPAVSVPEGYGSSGFQAVGIDFPSAGCWRITERLGSVTLAFVLLVSSSK